MRLRLEKSENRAGLLFAAPSLAGFSIFYIIPFIFIIYYSLIDNPASHQFVGLANYFALLSNPIFLKAGFNTIVFTIIGVPLIMILSLGLALLLNRSMVGRDYFRAAFILPLIVPVASVVLVWQVVFNFHGSLNSVVVLLGLNPVNWMNTSWARVIVTLFYLWKNAGYNMILFLAALQNIPRELYEAAYIDGAGSWQRLVNITLVHLIPTGFFVFIISVINSFKVFREVYLISGDYPHESIYMLQQYMNNMFMALDYQKLSTAAVITAALIIGIVYAFFKLDRNFRR
ncbi:MAG: carbohydrate ABC transporter permease [Chitinophagales bacterium]